MPASAKPIVVLGGSSPIGLELVRHLADTDKLLIFLADTPFERAVAAKSHISKVAPDTVIVALEIDIASDNSIIAGVQRIVSILAGRGLPSAIAGLVFATPIQPYIHRLGDPAGCREAMRLPFERVVTGVAASCEAFLPYINAWMRTRPIVLFLTGADSSLSHAAASASPHPTFDLSASVARVAINAVMVYFAKELPGASVLSAFTDTCVEAGEYDVESAGRTLAEWVTQDDLPLTASFVDLSGTLIPF